MGYKNLSRIFLILNAEYLSRILGQPIYPFFSIIDYICSMTTDMPNKIHEGRNVKRFREMLGMKQDALAYELGEDWTQKKISQLEQKETIEHDILEQVAKVLKVTPEAIKNFSEEAAISFVNNFNTGSVNHVTGTGHNYFPTFNPIDKVVELYERMLKEKDELIKQLSDKK